MKKYGKASIFLLLLLLIIGGGFGFLLSGSPSIKKYFLCSFNPFIDRADKERITRIIDTVADDRLFSLLGREAYLKGLADEVNQRVSDFAYWAYVLSTPALKEKMKEIQKSPEKYRGFVNGTSEKLLREYRDNRCFFKEAGGFARYLKLPEEEMIRLLKEALETKEGNAFRAYLDFLIEKSR